MLNRLLTTAATWRQEAKLRALEDDFRTLLEDAAVGTLFRNSDIG